MRGVGVAAAVPSFSRSTAGAEGVSILRHASLCSKEFNLYEIWQNVMAYLSLHIKKVCQMEISRMLTTMSSKLLAEKIGKFRVESLYKKIACAQTVTVSPLYSHYISTQRKYPSTGPDSYPHLHFYTQFCGLFSRNFTPEKKQLSISGRKVILASSQLVHFLYTVPLRSYPVK